MMVPKGESSSLIEMKLRRYKFGMLCAQPPDRTESLKRIPGRVFQFSQGMTRADDFRDRRPNRMSFALAKTSEPDTDLQLTIAGHFLFSLSRLIDELERNRMLIKLRSIFDQHCASANCVYSQLLPFCNAVCVNIKHTLWRRSLRRESLENSSQADVDSVSD